MQQDHYLTLGVGRDATYEEIRRAYRRLVRLYHPDVNPGVPDAHEELNRFNQAYEVLRDRVARDHYDRALDLFSRPRYERPRALTIPRAVADRRKRDLISLVLMTVVVVMVITVAEALCCFRAQVPLSWYDRGDVTHALATRFVPDQVDEVFGYVFAREPGQPEPAVYGFSIYSPGEPCAWMPWLSSKRDARVLAQVSARFKPLQISQ